MVVINISSLTWSVLPSTSLRWLLALALALKCRRSINNELEDGVRVCVCNFCAEFKKASKGWVAASKFQVRYDCAADVKVLDKCCDVSWIEKDSSMDWDVSNNLDVCA